MLRSGTCEDLFELEYTSDSNYVVPLMVTALVPINAEVVCDPLLVSRFGDDEEEGLVVEETSTGGEGAYTQWVHCGFWNNSPTTNPVGKWWVLLKKIGRAHV